ncbi:MAG: ubiquitin-like domain-containing protein [Microcoleus sp.]
MEIITITIRSVDGTFKRPVDVPMDMTISELRDGAQEQANLLQVPCDLILDKNNQILRESDTIQSAGIQSGALLTLTPRAEGG